VASPACRGNRRLALVRRGKQRLVGPCSIDVLSLQRGRLNMALADCSLLLCGRLGSDAVGTTVEADAVDRPAASHGPAVDVADVGVADVIDLAVIEELVVIPIAALEAHA